MGAKSQKEIPGVAFVVDSRGRRRSVLIDLDRHGALWEDDSVARTMRDDALMCPRFGTGAMRTVREITRLIARLVL